MSNEGYFIPADMMERIDRALKFYATYGTWHYSDREMRAPPRACSAMDRRPQAIIDSGKFAGEVYTELVKLYPLAKLNAAAPEGERSKEHEQRAAAIFLAYFIHNYPPRTIIADPAWHAPKIFRAVLYALRDGTPPTMNEG